MDFMDDLRKKLFCQKFLNWIGALGNIFFGSIRCKAPRVKENSNLKASLVHIGKKSVLSHALNTSPRKNFTSPKAQ